LCRPQPRRACPCRGAIPRRGRVPVAPSRCRRYPVCASVNARGVPDAMTTVYRWTGREAHMLRTATSETMREFCERHGVSTNAWQGWDTGGVDLIPTREMQRVLDTALAQADDDAKARFAQALAGQSQHKPRSPVSNDRTVPWTAAGAIDAAREVVED